MRHLNTFLFLFILLFSSISLAGVASGPDTLTLSLSGMTFHIGQKFEARLVSKYNFREVHRETISSIPGDSFTVKISGLEEGKSYWVQFYADLNQDGLYNTPPIDHAWQLHMNNADGDTTLYFIHNTDFLDIKWDYLFALDLSGMDLHLDQKFELRVVDKESGKEVGRETIPFIESASFIPCAPGLVLGRSYNIDFYADLNQNGHYDTPPTDHAWRLEVDNVAGDVMLDFSHNTTFTDIGWQYLFTLQMEEMTPHIGQLFELRVVHQSTEQEVGSIRIDSLLLSRHSILVPGLNLGEEYHVDFYADLNKNGIYDSPPTDHAWREIFTSNSGDVFIFFTHNINFTDIGWPTSIQNLNAHSIPTDYRLSQNFPNPFNPTTKIIFDLPIPGTVRLSVYNILGQQVGILINEEMDAGSYVTTWDGRDYLGNRVGTGTYFYYLQSEGFKQVRRMILLK